MSKLCDDCENARLEAIKRGTWGQIQRYSICPACARKLYPPKEEDDSDGDIRLHNPRDGSATSL